MGAPLAFSDSDTDGPGVRQVLLGVENKAVSLHEHLVALGDEHFFVPLDHDDQRLAGDLYVFQN